MREISFRLFSENCITLNMFGCSNDENKTTKIKDTRIGYYSEKSCPVFSKCRKVNHERPTQIYRR